MVIPDDGYQRPPYLMRILRPAGCLMGMLMVGCASPSVRPVTPENVPGLFVAAYHPWWAGETWRDYPFSALDRLYFFEVELAPDGTIAEDRGWPGSWRELAHRAGSDGVDVVPSIGIHGENAFEVLFADPRNRARAVESLLRLLDTRPAPGGLHLDLEVFRPVSASVRDGYTAFVTELEARMRAHDPSMVLSIFTLAFDDSDVYDEVALAARADYLVVQGYDLHSRDDIRAGPLAALEGWGRLNWSTIVERFERMGIPLGRIVMGLPLYGYEWPTEGPEPGSPTRGPGVALPLAAPDDVEPQLPRAGTRAALHGVRRDPESDIPYYIHRREDGWVQGWFEDDRSIRRKIEFVRARGLGGIALFPLAYAPEGVRRLLLDLHADPRRVRIP